MRRWQTSPLENLEQRLASWRGHAQQADTYHLLHSFGLAEAVHFAQFYFPATPRAKSNLVVKRVQA